jgi:nitrate reductase gamma subunit
MVVEFPAILAPPIVDLGAYIVLAIVVILLTYRSYAFRASAPFIYNYIVLIYRSSISLGIKKTLRILISVVLKDVAIQLSSFETYRRQFTHMCIFWGFVGLSITTALDNFVNHEVLPLPLTSPIRVLGNVSGGVIMVGLTIALCRRLIYRELRERTSGYDLLFFFLLYAVSITGFATEFASMADAYNPTYVAYWAHIILIALLFVTAPLTKFVHSLKLPLLILFYRLRQALVEAGALVPFQPIGSLEEQLLRRGT